MKLSREYLVLLLILLFNAWFWKIFSFNFIIAFILFIFSVFLFLNFRSKNYTKIILVLFALLVGFQFKTSSFDLFRESSDYEKYVQEQRMGFYPSTGSLPIAYWLEAKPITLVVNRIATNAFEVLDPNLYFFANHPREEVYRNNFEKFFYLLTPFFILGVLRICDSREMLFLVLCGSSFLTLAFLGNSAPAGPFLFFPFLAVSIAIGIKTLFKI